MRPVIAAARVGWRSAGRWSSATLFPVDGDATSVAAVRSSCATG